MYRKIRKVAFLPLVLFISCAQDDPVRFTAVEDEHIPLEAHGPTDPIAQRQSIRGGVFNAWGASYPRSLNMWLDYNSLTAEIAGLQFESLVVLHSTRNEPVGELADSWDISADGMTFTFYIHPDARWSDGKPVIARDIQFYYDTIMNEENMTSLFRVGMSRFNRPEVINDKTVRIQANEDHWQNFWEAAGFSAFPTHEWENKDFNSINFEFPVVSGPYRISNLRTNRYVVLQRRSDWWGRTRRYNQNKYNFDYIRYRFMEDRIKSLEALRRNDFDAYAIYTASIWATRTKFDQVEKNWIIRQKIQNQEPRGFQGFAINLRRERFQDLNVRKALNLLLNRQLMNEKLMYDQYFLLNSFYPDLYPNYVNPNRPVTEYDPEKARELLAEAGWQPNRRGILEKDGREFKITFLTHQGADMRHFNVYFESLRRVGIVPEMDMMSMSSVRHRLQQHDFDLFWVNWGAGRLKNPEPMWHSRTADQPASNNLPGVADTRIDSLIERQKSITDIDTRNDILKEIDNRLNEIVPYVLLWQSDATRLLYWNRFGMPDTVLNKYNRENSAVVYWWHDPEKADRLARAIENNEPLAAEPEIINYSEITISQE